MMPRNEQRMELYLRITPWTELPQPATDLVVFHNFLYLSVINVTVSPWVWVSDLCTTAFRRQQQQQHHCCCCLLTVSLYNRDACHFYYWVSLSVELFIRPTNNIMEWTQTNHLYQSRKFDCCKVSIKNETSIQQSVFSLQMRNWSEGAKKMTVIRPTTILIYLIG